MIDLLGKVRSESDVKLKEQLKKAEIRAKEGIKALRHLEQGRWRA